jgi:hypothetical protein
MRLSEAKQEFNRSSFYKGNSYKDYITQGEFTKVFSIETSGVSLLDAGRLIAYAPLVGTTEKFSFQDFGYDNLISPKIPQGIAKIGTVCQVWTYNESLQRFEVTTYKFVSRVVYARANQADTNLISRLNSIAETIGVSDPFGFWLEIRSSSYATVIASEETALTEEDIEQLSKMGRKSSILPLLITGAGLVTGNPVLSIGGLLLRFVK